MTIDPAKEARMWQQPVEGLIAVGIQRAIGPETNGVSCDNGGTK